jgi:hypothetical protein
MGHRQCLLIHYCLALHDWNSGVEIMVKYPPEVRRCQHIKGNGTQCGSPALRKEKFCYYHHQCAPVTVAIDGKSEILLPVFDDASSIQIALRQVTQMLLEKKIEPKSAGLVLYALQIASSNLKQISMDKPRPTQVVVDPRKVGKTLLGMTPWAPEGLDYEYESASDGYYAREEREAENLKFRADICGSRAGEYRSWIEKDLLNVAQMRAHLVKLADDTQDEGERLANRAKMIEESIWACADPAYATEDATAEARRV